MTGLIAKGGHSAVYHARDLDTFEPLAIKAVTMDANGKSVYRVELSILRALPPHRNIPALKGHLKSKEESYLILPFLPFPNLQGFITERGPLEEVDALFILAQMIDTLNFMRQHGVAHRDIKAENIIINPDNLQIKFIDFGLGKKLRNEWSKSDQFIGTPIYMAPEVIRREKPFWVTVADLFSVGVVFLELLLGAQPFASALSEPQLLDMQAGFDYSTLPKKSASILKVLLAQNPKDRLEGFDFVQYLPLLSLSLFSILK
eukprot:TRINITY_DN351_c0_g1_i2.p1 TRINITY_DN351_c0_g1~~TRINITY_DN351_c0_g1_i2.p1  ORF type:complete len:277 (-),score=65.67 TRINITY_DN351_c0_g1_i2:405-1184(-)